MMLDEGAYDAGRSFGPQREPAPAAIFEDVHFFLDDIGRFAERSLEQVQRFKRGRSDLGKTVSRKGLTGGAFQALELGTFGGQNVFGSTNRLVFRHG